MSFNTESDRNSALIDSCGILIPDGLIDIFDCGTLLGWYSSSATPTGFIQIANEAVTYPTIKDESYVE